MSAEMPVITSAKLDDRDGRVDLVVKYGQKGLRPTKLRFPLHTARDTLPVRLFFRRLGVEDTDRLDFDDRTGDLIDPMIVGKTVLDRAPDVVIVETPWQAEERQRRQDMLEARWTPEERERHGYKIHHGQKRPPKKSVDLVLGDLDQLCLACGTREAASEYCTACAALTGPALWYDRKTYLASSAANARSHKRKKARR